MIIALIRIKKNCAFAKRGKEWVICKYELKIIGIPKLSDQNLLRI